MFKLDLFEETFAYRQSATGRDVIGFMDSDGSLYVISDPLVKFKVKLAEADSEGFIVENGESEPTWRVEPDGYIFRHTKDGQWIPKGYVDEYGRIWNWSGQPIDDIETEFEGRLGKQVGFVEPQGGNPAVAAILFMDVARRLHKFMRRLNYLNTSAEKVVALNSIERVMTEIEDFKLDVESSDLPDFAKNAMLEATKPVIDILNKKRSEIERELKQNYEEMKERAMELLEEAKKGSIFVQIREHLKDFQEIARKVRMKPEHREEVLSIIQQAFDILWERQQKWRESAQAERERNYELLRKELEELDKLVRTTHDFRNTRMELIKFQDKTKTLPLESSKRSELIAELNNLFNILRARQSEWAAAMELERQRNYEQMKKEVEDCVELAQKTRYFKEAREHFNRIRERLRELPMTREHKDELFSKLREAYAILGERQAEYRRELEKEFNENYQRLSEMVSKGLEMAQTSPSFNEARDYLRQVRDELRNTRMRRDQKDELFDRLRAAFDILWERQKRWQAELETEFQRNFQELSEAVDRCITLAEIERDFRYVYSVLNDVYREIRRARLKREDRRRLIEKIDQAYAILRRREMRYGR
ncbi:MAG: hypothetical protein DRQ10_00965 [Candidatus Hydrothermota bacterium]|nr:MAG: hypothetical protein DRQ10_00965 [Candidatus Hydrothermae bacterium]